MALSPLACILLVGLWTEADDQGIFEWKPLTMKARLLPAANADVGELLEEIAGHLMVRRFTVDGKVYGAVRNFRKYQRPKRPNAVFPLPDELRPYVGLTAPNGGGVPPKGEHVPPKGGISPQMEEGGWRMDEEGEDVDQSPSRAETPREPEAGGAGLGGKYDDLRDRLCEAAGWQPQRANGRLEVVGPILALIENGADLDLDVLPVVKSLAPKCRSPTWTFFVGAIQDAKAARLVAGSDVRAPPGNVVSMPGVQSRASASRRQFNAFDEVFDEPHGERSDEAGIAGAVPRLAGPGTGGERA